MKKLAIALLALVMVLTTVLVPILADNEATAIGYSAARVKKADLTQVKNIKEYDKDNVDPGYKITDADGLKLFSELVNGGQTFESCYIYLAKDIDMAGVEGFLPIGHVEYTITKRYSADHAERPNGIETCALGVEHPFKGTFNGHGHVIDNLVINVSSENVLYAGFFGYADGATISNLILGEGCSVTQTVYNDWSAAGALTGKSAGGVTFENVLNAADVVSESPHAAGFFGRGAATVRNSTNLGDMTATNSGGGFSGFNESTTVIENCRNTGTITASTAAGFVSRLRGNVTVKNSINNGTIIGHSFANGIGGNVDRPSGTRAFEDCINYGELKGAEGKEDSVKTNPICSYDAKFGEDEIPVPTQTNCEDKRGEEDATNVAIEIVCNPNQEEDGVGDGETAYVTTQPPYKPEIGVNENPTGKEVGYSSVRVVEVDTTAMVDILNYDERPNEDFYKITNAAGFRKLDEALYNYATFSTVTFYLANDIDMSEIQGFQPISYDIEHVKQVNGSPRYYFAGTIDGQGEAITNLKMLSKEEPLKFDSEGKVDMENGTVVSEALVCVGLFGVTGGITINNLVIDQSCEFGYTGTAANPCVAALVAKSTGSIKVDNVWNQANISGGRFNGAVSGRPSGKYEIKNMTNSGDIFGAQCVGGFFGFDGAGGVIENCRNTGDIKRVGAGDAFHNCSAGFVARALAGVTFRNCINNGNVEGAANAGAFMGTIHGGNILEDCKNYGVLTATAKPDAVGVAYARQAEKDGQLQGTAEVKNVQDLAGTQDPTLMFEIIEIDCTPEEGVEPPPPTEATTEATTKKPPVTTKAPGGNGGASTTKAPGGNATTAAPAGDNTTDDTTEKKGCGSTVFGGVAVIMIVSGAALTLFKKKED